MDSEGQRRQRIESIRDDYLAGETPVMVCTLMKGQFISSPWRDEKTSSQLASSAKPHLPITRTSNAQLSPTSTLQSSTPPPPTPQAAPTASHDGSTQEFESDNERTIPYDMYDTENPELEDANLTVSSSPPK